MLSPKLKKSLTGAALLLGLSYPFIVYFGLSAFSPQIMISIVLLVLGLRIVLMGKSLPRKNRLLWPSVVALCLMGVGAFLHATVAVKLYPVAISLLLGTAFFWSLFYPPTTIEMIARITEPDLDDKGVSYTRKVTLIWVVFFLLNATIAGWTVVYGTLEQWTLYNGFISYCLTGALLGAEYLVRRVVRAKEAQ